MQRVDPILPSQRTGYVANLLTQQARLDARRRLKASASKPSVTAPSPGARIDIRA